MYILSKQIPKWMKILHMTTVKFQDYKGSSSADLLLKVK